MKQHQIERATDPLLRVRVALLTLSLSVFAGGAASALGFAFSQHAVIHKNAGELFADSPVQ